MNSIDKAVLLVGGKGTRLMPLTTNTPKPMLKIAGVPVTEHQIVKAREAGIKEIVLATSYLAEVFEPYFGDGSRFGIKINTHSKPSHSELVVRLQMLLNS